MITTKRKSLTERRLVREIETLTETLINQRIVSSYLNDLSDREYAKLNNLERQLVEIKNQLMLEQNKTKPDNLLASEGDCQFD